MEKNVPPAFRKTAERFATGAKTLPRSYLVSPDVFAEERERIFSTHWLCIGHQSQIAAPGDYFAPEVGDESLLALRDQKGQLRAFYNVCRHRGTRLCQKKSGQLRGRIQCPYHAWTYGLDGRLIGAPLMDKVIGFDKAQHALHPVNLASCEGFIFVKPARHSLARLSTGSLFAPRKHPGRVGSRIISGCWEFNRR